MTSSKIIISSTPHRRQYAMRDVNNPNVLALQTEFDAAPVIEQATRQRHMREALGDGKNMRFLGIMPETVFMESGYKMTDEEVRRYFRENKALSAKGA